MSHHKSVFRRRARMRKRASYSSHFSASSSSFFFFLFLLIPPIITIFSHLQFLSKLVGLSLDLCWNNSSSRGLHSSLHITLTATLAFLHYTLPIDPSHPIIGVQNLNFSSPIYTGVIIIIQNASNLLHAAVEGADPVADREATSSAKLYKSWKAVWNLKHRLVTTKRPMSTIAFCFSRSFSAFLWFLGCP